MNRYPLPDKRSFNWLTIATLLASAPYAFYLPPWIFPTFLGLLGWSYLIERQGWQRPGRTLLLTLLALFLVLVLRQHQTVLGRDAGLSLLLLMFGLKFLELKTLRDHILLTLLLFLLILGNLLFSQSLGLALHLTIAVIACIATLSRMALPSGMGAITRIRLSVGIFLKAIPLMIVLYLLFPRLQGGFWMLPGSSTGTSGFSDTVRLGTISRMVKSDQIAFRVKFDGSVPPAQQLYWRGLVLNHTDGRQWQRNQQNVGVIDTFTPTGPPVRYELMLEPTWQRWVFALDLPGDAPGGVRHQPGYSLETTALIQERVSFKISSFPYYRTPALTAITRQNSLQLPRYISTRITKLVDTWRRDAQDNPQEIADSALRYFRQQKFYYTLEPPLLGGDPVDEFLFDTRRGFCEHFASAFTTLMRVAGIPARIIVGYQGGEFNEAGNYLIVRQQDAHAWSEIWLPQSGWTRIDPTSAVAPERIEYGLDAVQQFQLQGLDYSMLTPSQRNQALRPKWPIFILDNIQRYWDAGNVLWYSWVLDFTAERQRQLLDELGFLTSSVMNQLVAVAGSTLLFFALLTAVMSRNKQRVDNTQKLYLQYCKKLERVGLRRRHNEGPLNYMNRVRKSRPDLAQMAAQVADLYIELRYASSCNGQFVKRFKRMTRRFKPNPIVGA
ncbi:MAG: DUF3488 and transglutaminase-like domain-containing protein [Gammaproteobacteria bacterium]|nr:DUF3488 and transglutaminase-like domain-containing protein [Gammaproteobacteria bacterium]